MEQLIVGMKVRVTNPKANPRHTILALSKEWVKLSRGRKVFKLRRARIEWVNIQKRSIM